jgi:soluble lytic murein transglycosylase-like protein
MAYPQNDMLNNTPLGMYFQGQSIGDEQRKNRETSETHALKYLMDQMMAGDNLSKSNLEGARANTMNTPEMLDWYGKGYAGQMKSQDASGRMAQATYEPELAAKIQDLKNKQLVGQLDQGYNEERANKWGAIRNGEYPANANIGFPMQGQQPQASGTIGFPNNSLKATRDRLESGGKDYNADGSPMKSSTGALFKNQVMPSTAAAPGFGIKPAASQTPEEYNRVGDEYLDALEKKYGGDQEKTLAAYNAGPAAIDALIAKHGDAWKEHLPQETKTYLQKAGTSSNVLSKFSQPGNNPWLAGVDTSDPRWNAMQGFRMDTPEFRQKMAGAEHRTDAQMEQTQLRAQALKDAQAAKVKLDNPKYKEQLAAAFVTADNPQAAPDARAKAKVFIDYHRQMLLAANPNNYQEGVDLSQYGVKTRPAPTAQIPQPGSSTAQRKPLAEF